MSAPPVAVEMATNSAKRPGSSRSKRICRLSSSKWPTSCHLDPNVCRRCAILRSISSATGRDPKPARQYFRRPDRAGQVLAGGRSRIRVLTVSRPPRVISVPLPRFPSPNGITLLQPGTAGSNPALSSAESVSAVNSRAVCEEARAFESSEDQQALIEFLKQL